MNRPARLVIVGGTLLALIVTWGFLRPPGSGAEPPSRDVIVVNPATAPALVRDVAIAARRPFHAKADIGWGPGDSQAGGPGGFALITVPAGKRLIIEYASGGFNLPAGQKLLVELNTGLGPTTVFHRVVVHGQGAFTDADLFVVGQQVRIPAEGEIHVFAFRSSTDGSGTGQFVVAGYLEDL